ncbi:hypothetical protein ATI14_1759 [Pseudomonas tolaasii NCPPB 2192]|uniref:LSD1 subclass zinc finger protein n=1 Tax=Pseudomonas tolaasii NCPPB 2192 TaxID=564423 RepID=A0ABX4QDV6_PSETO|nr:hypothetical protein B5P22_21240 [Pseudomonas tolaasii]KAB0468470.1 hypothetical protein F7R12_22935 [Pseudomonas tolaasii]PKA74908.1 hypothetical protein ATI14_1759 [Pseudomonas tolaasii NCPPB 2192]
MGHTFECANCKRIKTEAVPYFGSGLMCAACRRSLIPPPTVEPPRMRRPEASCAPSFGSLMIVLVFVAGAAVGAKMAGGW